MKQKVNGPVGIAIVVVVSIVVIGFLYTRYFQEKSISPEETLKHMSAAGKH